MGIITGTHLGKHLSHEALRLINEIDKYDSFGIIDTFNKQIDKRYNNRHMVNTENGFKILFELNEVKKERIKFETNLEKDKYCDRYTLEGKLIINTDTHDKTYKYSYFLPKNKTINEGLTKAKFEDGILEVQFYYEDIEEKKTSTVVEIK